MMENALSNIQIHIHVYSLSRIREFKKLRRLLQRKRHVNIELFVRLSAFTIIPCLSRYRKQVKCTSVCLVRMVFKFTWGQRMKNLLLRACVVVRTSNMKISRRPLADYVKTMHKKACRTCSTIIFPHSANQIIDLWRCRGRCCRHFLNSLFAGGSTRDEGRHFWTLFFFLITYLHSIGGAVIVTLLFVLCFLNFMLERKIT